MSRLALPARPLAQPAVGSVAWGLIARVAMLGVTLVGFALRVLGLGGPSLWYDEGFAVMTARRAWPDIVARLIAEDNHSPLHYLVMHVWAPLSGNTEFGLRFSSVVAGLLLPPLTYAIARQVYAGRTTADRDACLVGVPAATLVALSPFLVYYAREARMYSLLAAFGLLAVWALLRATRDATPLTRWAAVWPWLSHGAVVALAVYTQYMGILLVPAFAVYTALCGRRAWLRWLASMMLAATLLLPWAPAAWLQMRRLVTTSPALFPSYLGPEAVVTEALTSFLALTAKPLAVGVGVAILVGALALFAWRWPRDRGLARREALPALVAGGSLVLIAVASASIAKFVSRYAIAAAPMLSLALVSLLYALLCQPRAALRAAYAAVLLILTLYLAPLAWSATRMPWVAHEDARGLAAYLTERAREEQAIVYIDDRTDAFDFYYHGRASHEGLAFGFDFDLAATRLNRLLARRPERVWLVLWQHEAVDPTGLVITELQRRSEKHRGVVRSFREYTLLRFDLTDWSPIVPTPAPQQIIDANFGDRLTLVGADRLADSPGYLSWILYWQARERLDRDYSVAVQLRDASGAVRLTHNQSPSTPWLATAGMPSGLTVRGLTEVDLPPDLTPGRYTVDVLVWDRRDQRNLDYLDGNGAPQGISLPLGVVDITSRMLAKP